MLALDQALDELERVHQRMAQVVELHYFAGFTAAETAQILDITGRTAERDLAAARSWLRSSLEPA